jgi:hypothetical protein
MKPIQLRVGAPPINEYIICIEGEDGQLDCCIQGDAASAGYAVARYALGLDKQESRTYARSHPRGPWIVCGRKVTSAN